jgi:UDP-N-acetylglucosamine 1-carboxyvinyltransferase
LAQGTTTIKNVAIEPEIIELITMLQLMGALIYMKSDREIVVEGVDKLQGVTYECPGDRIEAVSWACLACATDGSLEVNGIKPHMLGSFLSYFQKAGGGITLNSPTSLTFYRARDLSPVAFETDVYPGFSTDWQQPFGVLLTQAEGASVIHETVYEKRFTHALPMKAMGASIELSPYCLGSTPCRFSNKDYGHSLVIFGKTPLFALDELVIPDLRAGLAYLIAACLAHGETRIINVDLLERGYGDILERLSQTNIHIRKVDASE